MIYLDTEYCNTQEKQVTPVCCATYDDITNKVKTWWTLNSPETIALLNEYIIKNSSVDYFSYNAVAEGRYFLACGLDPYKYNWIDGFLEYRCLTNHNDLLCWGEQLVDGTVRTVRKPPPKWERVEGENMNSFKPTHSLAEATFKLTGVVRDTAHKDAMRDILISGNLELIEANREDIMKYCVEDTIHLPTIYNSILDNYKKLIKSPSQLELLHSEMLLRGKYSALTAKMESRGYPISYSKTMNFTKSVLPMLDECQREINSLFPEICPFKYDWKDDKFKWDQTKTREWLSANIDTNKWQKTDGYKKAVKMLKRGENLKSVAPYLSLSLEAFERVFNFTHDYPKDNFGAQIVRYLKLKQNLNGFVISPKKRNFWDFVGSDKRVRAYFNIFGAQSSRSQPGSTGYLFLKPAWMRALCEPPPGKAIACFDYTSEEFLITALQAKDAAMIRAFASGDIYLAFAKAAGMVPQDATKSSHKLERNMAKSTVLGISYMMSKIGLSAKLTADTGVPVSEERAEELINLFYESYPDFSAWQTRSLEEYYLGNPIKLPSGWYMWKDNDPNNFRSVANCPIQGLGADIMRKAVEFCEDAGLETILTLHDALYIEYDSHDYSKIDIFYECMMRAFTHYFDDKESAGLMRLEGFSWSPDYEKECKIKTPKGLEIDISDIYIDDRSLNEYETFSQYLHERSENLL